VEIKEGVVGG
jgi:hypothetical protein